MKKLLSLIFAISLTLPACGIVSTKPTPPVQTETPTVTPTATQTPTATIAPLPTQTPTTIITPLPTLLMEDQENYVKEFLESSRNCRLPCWWGITPGKTSWKETETLLHHLGAIIFPFQSKFGGNRYAARLLGLPEFDLSFYENEIISPSIHKIHVGGNVSGVQDQREFEIFWESYSPKEVMSKYGIPSRILIDTLGTLGNTNIGIHGYTLWVFYDSLGFMIRYDGFIADKETFRFCFNLNPGANDIDRIELTLQHQDYAFPLEHDDSILGSASPRGIPFQNITGISIETFHQLFTQAEKPYCLETSHDIWPTR